MGKYHEAVINGAEFLDDIFPGWYKWINEDKFDIGDCTACILGQLYGGYISGLTILDLNQKGAQNYGFEAPSAHSNLYHTRWKTEYSILNFHWSKQIEKRLLNDGVDIDG